MPDFASTDKILVLDIGGSHIKATILNAAGELQVDYKRIDTPRPATPQAIMTAVQALITGFPPFDKVAAGFPGYVKEGVIKTAPNLDNEHWQNVNLEALLTDTLGKPAKVVNDADLQGIGVVSGTGLELVITLGTGFGTALLYNGKLLPHLEMAHHPITKNKTYDDYVGEKALEEEGKEKWNERMQKVIAVLKTVFNYDHLYISGGNSAKLNFKLDDNITIDSNKDGIKGGARLWQ